MIEARERTHQPPHWAAIAAGYAVVSATAAAAVARSGPESFLRMHAVWLLLWATTTAVALACSGQWYRASPFQSGGFRKAQ